MVLRLVFVEHGIACCLGRGGGCMDFVVGGRELVGCMYLSSTLSFPAATSQESRRDKERRRNNKIHNNPEHPARPNRPAPPRPASPTRPSSIPVQYWCVTDTMRNRYKGALYWYCTCTALAYCAGTALAYALALHWYYTQTIPALYWYTAYLALRTI